MTKSPENWTKNVGGVFIQTNDDDDGRSGIGRAHFSFPHVS